MNTVEIHLSQPGEIADELKRMRIWLDDQRYEPSRFIYDLDGDAAVVRLDFKTPREAELFAGAFQGRVLTEIASGSSPESASLITVVASADPGQNRSD